MLRACCLNQVLVMPEVFIFVDDAMLWLATLVRRAVRRPPLRGMSAAPGAPKL